MIDKILKNKIQFNKKKLLLLVICIIVFCTFVEIVSSKNEIYQMNVKNYTYRSSIKITNEVDTTNGLLIETTTEIFEDEVVQDGKTEVKDYKVSYHKEEDYKNLGRKISIVEWTQDWGDYYPGKTGESSGKGIGLTWPADVSGDPGTAKITSLFGWQWERDEYSKDHGVELTNPHIGVDISCGSNGSSSKILAAHAGKVTEAGSDLYNTITIEGSDGKYTTRYLHCSSVLVNVGDAVSKGQTIGTMGGQGPKGAGHYDIHLHFEVFDNSTGERIDPLTFYNLTPEGYDYTSDRNSKDTERSRTPEGYYSYASDITAVVGDPDPAVETPIEKVVDIVSKANTIVEEEKSNIKDEIRAAGEIYFSANFWDKLGIGDEIKFVKSVSDSIEKGVTTIIARIASLITDNEKAKKILDAQKKIAETIIGSAKILLTEKITFREKVTKILDLIGDKITSDVINNVSGTTSDSGSDSSSGSDSGSGSDSDSDSSSSTGSESDDKKEMTSALAKAQSEYKKNEIYPAKTFNEKKYAYDTYAGKGYSYDDLYFAFRQIEQYYAELKKNEGGDGKGNNLGGLIWPVQLEEGNEGGNKITSLWGLQQDREGVTVQANHPAIDIAGGGTPNILAATAGTVIDYWGQYGAVTIQSDDGKYLTQYMHMEPVMVNVGDHVTQGQVVGVMGGAGGYPVHLHFAVAMDTNGDGTINSDMNTETVDPVEFYNVEAVGGQTPDPYPYGDNNRTADWRYGYTGGSQYYKYLSAKAGVGGGSNMEIIWNYFVGTLGCSEEAAAGIMGNFDQESAQFTYTFPTTNTEYGEPGRDGAGGYGIAQWTGGRRQIMFDTATNNGYDVNDIYYQLEYFKMEIYRSGSWFI